jgi:CrcB protein
MRMDLPSLLAVGCGAFLGAVLRWMLGLWLNPLFPTLPLGTLGANLLGGLLMGMAIGVLSQFDALSPAARLFFTTGFLG